MQNSLQFIKCFEIEEDFSTSKVFRTVCLLPAQLLSFFSFFYFSSHAWPGNSPAAPFCLSFILHPNSLRGPDSFPAHSPHQSAPQPTLLSLHAARFLEPFLPSTHCHQWLSRTVNPVPNPGLTRQPELASSCLGSSLRTFILLRFKRYRS
jgi:hypothetical protein